MASVEEILQRFAALSERAEQLRIRLEYESGEVRSARDRVQASFGDQQEGRQAAMQLDTAMGQLMEAEGLLRNIQSETRVAMARIRS